MSKPNTADYRRIAPNPTCNLDADNAAAFVAHPFFKGEGNITEAFWGQEVKSCNIKRVSDSGSMKLNISVDGENVFTSGMKDASEVTYP